MSATAVTVRRVAFGYFVRPAEETGTGAPRVEPVLGYVVSHPRGTLLVDTGMGSHPEVDAHYRPRRVPLEAALSEVDVAIGDVDIVVNCHLHFDHCGGNPRFRGRRVVVQARELADAHAPDYTLPELVDVPGLDYEEIDGDVDVWDGIHVVATPGHTNGHQSVVVRRSDGTVIVIAGQSHDNASAYAADVLAIGARRDGAAAPLPTTPKWMERLERFDPRKVVFAHDFAVWMPD